MRKCLWIFICFVIFFGCGLGNIKKTTELYPGMTSAQVKGILGNPSSTQYTNDYVIWKYSLHQYWVGWVPYYLAFWAKEMTLAAWQANMSEYYATQQLWIESLPKQHRVIHDGRIDVHQSGTIYHEIR